jgi:hypothetical protein
VRARTDFRAIVSVPQPGLVDYGGDDGEVSKLYQSVEAIHKYCTLLLILQEDEGRLLLPDFAFMQDDNVMTEVLELECLHLWYDGIHVVLLPKDTEVEHEDRIVPIDLL